MTYLAPRQGLFAIILLLSFLLHTTLLIISSDQQLDELKLQTGNRMLTQLVEEVKLPLLSKDKVSLSVLTGRYTSENNVANLTVTDTDHRVLLQTGQAQLLSGEVIRRPVVFEDTIVGEVALTLRDTSNGEIIAAQWLFILGSFIVHLLIWLIYGYTARPTRSQLAALSRDVQDHFMSQQRTKIQRTRRDEPLENLMQEEATDNNNYADSILARSHAASSQNRDNVDNSEQVSSLDKGDKRLANINIQQALNQYVQSHQEGGDVSNNNFDSDNSNDGRSSNDSIDSDVSLGSNTPVNTPITNGFADRQTDRLNFTNSEANQTDDLTTGSVSQGLTPSSMPDIKGRSNGMKRRPLDAKRLMSIACIQIHFYDPYHLMNTLAPEQSRPYLALCTQLLQRTVTELLKQPLLQGIALKQQSVFDEHGATVEFVDNSQHGKIALAGVMLAEAYMMLHEITCLKFRELKWFSLDVYIGVSDQAVTSEMQKVLENNAKASDIYTLLPLMGIKQLKGHMQLQSLTHPTSVYERDAALLKGSNEAMMQRLVDVRNAVLLSAESAADTP